MIQDEMKRAMVQAEYKPPLSHRKAQAMTEEEIRRDEKQRILEKLKSMAEEKDAWALERLRKDDLLFPGGPTPSKAAQDAQVIRDAAYKIESESWDPA